MNTLKKATALLLTLVMLCSAGFAFAEGEGPMRVALLNAFENEDAIVPDELIGLIEYRIFERMIDIVQALSSSTVDYGRTATICADYIVANNDQMTCIDADGYVRYFMGTRSDDAQLQAMLNEGIKALKENGKLDELISIWLTDIGSTQPSAKPLPVIEGAQTIRVAVTGDMPPLDYTDVLGNPAGFNIAMLTALSEVMNVNFETVTLDSPARLMALATGTVDVLFYTFGHTEQSTEPDERVLLTDSYFECGVKRLYLKARKEEMNARLARLGKAIAEYEAKKK